MSVLNVLNIRYMYMNNDTTTAGRLSDLEYITHMIPHHQIAVDMSEQLLRYTTIPGLLALCRDIIRSQQYEIWELENMKKLEDIVGNSNNNHRNQPHTMKKITDKEYLLHMIPHHQFAIDISRQLLLYTKNTYLITLATKIIIQQKTEIMIMRGMLDKNAFLFESELVDSNKM